MPEPVAAAGGVVYKSDQSSPEILLIYRRETWDLPKGKLESGESIPGCARREVAEETGLNSPEIVADLGTTYHEYERNDTRYGKTTYWYAMKPADEESDLKPQQEESIQKVEWIPLDEAIAMVGFENLKRKLSEFKEWYSQHKT